MGCPAKKVCNKLAGSALLCDPGQVQRILDAVVADIIDVVRTLTADPENRVPHLAFQPHARNNFV